MTAALTVTPSVSTAVLSAMDEAAQQEILPRWRALGEHEIRTKTADWDLVTDADVEAERRLTIALREIADVPVVGEEATSADASLLDLVAGAEACWLVDPVDGTRNFVHGKEQFACMVAYVEGGHTQGAWITHPAVGRELHAARGAGAFIDGVRVESPAVPDADALRGALPTKSFPTGSAGLDDRAASLGPFQDIRFCAGWDYWDAATGAVDYVWFTRTFPWDHAPGSLICLEAGLASRRPDGSEYLPGDGGRGILTAHPAVWDRVAGAFTA